jgi:RimJ/RimL family protein N-acetyltransferase
MTYENTPTITTERLILRKFTPDDAEALFDILKDVEVNTFLPWFPLKSLDEAKQFLQRHFSDCYEKPSAYRYAVCLKADDRPIGYVCLADDESRDFGYCIKREHWHKGIATEAAGAVAERIKNAGCAYITATHDVNNPRSGEVMKKLGMVYKYSFVEQWQPKNLPVTFRLYQRNFNGDGTYAAYWDTADRRFVEDTGDVGVTEYSFAAAIEIVGVNPFVRVPEDILGALFARCGRDKGAIPIRGTVCGSPYTQTLVKFKGLWRLYVNTFMLKNSPGRVGEVIDLTVAFDPVERTIAPPPELVKALEENPAAKVVFDGLSPSRRHELVRYIASLKTPESVTRNVARAVAFLCGNGRFVGRDRP